MLLVDLIGSLLSYLIMSRSVCSVNFFEDHTVDIEQEA